MIQNTGKTPEKKTNTENSYTVNCAAMHPIFAVNLHIM